MNEIVELLKYSLPAIILALVVYYAVNQLLKLEKHKQEKEIKLLNAKTFLPLKIQAYERVVLFVERITPENLIVRVNRSGLSAVQLKTLLTKSIREEYEHNISQQIYISPKAWELVKNAKESMINLVNTAYANLKNDAGAADLIRAIFDNYLAQDPPLLSIALNFLKMEMQKEIR